MNDFIEIRPISDGYHLYPHPRELLFPEANRESIKKAGGPGIDWKEWKSPYTSTLIQDGKEKILVDAGAGKLVPTAGLLLDNLREVGVEHDEIDVLVISHLHPDHIAGLLHSDKHDVFPNARILLSEAELHYWSSKPDLEELDIPKDIKEMIQTAADHFLERYSSRIEAVSMDEHITSHVRLFAAPGHTPGHIGVEVDKGDKPTLIVGDAFLHPLHIANPEWTASVDQDPAATIRTRRRILERLRTKSAAMLGFHLPGAHVP
jgi:glyoxylase-like metal-dependent hydrolase (beta-lactamase superfamily II)